MGIVIALFVIVVAAVLGGLLSKLLKLPSLVGYIIAGIFFGAVLPQSLKSVTDLAQIGTILLLFSVGVELSLAGLTKFFKIAVFGSIIQVILSTLIFFAIFNLFQIPLITSLILAIGFSISSTAVIVKILSDRGEVETIHGQVMLSWSLVQDLMVIPIMVILPILGSTSVGWGGVLAISLSKALLVVAGFMFIGKILVPPLFHKVAEANSRELLLLTSIGLALGTAVVTSFFGISPALGAFLAGVVISESQEHHAIFSETRPLRDLFVALFFVTLGLLVNPQLLIAKFPLIILLTLTLLILKALIVFIISAIFGYKGKTAVNLSFGLAQVGEFAFIIFGAALGLKLLSPDYTSIGISVTLLTLMIAPILIKFAIPFWRKAHSATSKIPFLYSLFATGEKSSESVREMTDHIIICGYGRVGSWIGKVLREYGIPFVVIDYNQKVVQELKDGGSLVIYGDPTEPEVLDAAGVRGAKAIILAIPDRVAQETLIAYVQTIAPEVKIISRAHLDSDWEKLKTLKVDKIVQPEFEAAVEIIRSILISRGKNREEISEVIKGLRVSHSN